MDQELWKLIASQGIVATLLFLALKWLLKDRDKAWGTASDEQKKRLELLETISSNRSQELIALRSEFAEYRKTTQSEISAIHAKHTEQVITITAQYNKQLDGLQTEIRGLYKMMLEQKLCPVGSDFIQPSIIQAGGK